MGWDGIWDGIWDGMTRFRDPLSPPFLHTMVSYFLHGSPMVPHSLVPRGSPPRPRPAPPSSRPALPSWLVLRVSSVRCGAVRCARWFGSFLRGGVLGRWPLAGGGGCNTQSEGEIGA
jgi:hypothetical protein